MNGCEFFTMILQPLMPERSILREPLSYNSLRKGHGHMKEQIEARELTAKAQAEESDLAKHDYLNLLNKATKKDPYYPVPHVLLGVHHFKERDMMKAVSALTRAVELNYLFDNDEEMAGRAYISLGKIYQMTENKEKSLHYYKTFAGLFPHSGAAAKLVRQIYIKNQNIDEWFALFKNGYDAFVSRDYGIALKILEETLLLHKVFPWTYYYMGRALMGMGNYDEAVANLKKSLELDEHFVFYYAIHEAYEALGEQKEGKYHLEKALALNPYYHLVLLSAEHHHQKDDVKHGAPVDEIAEIKAPDADFAERLEKKSSALVDKAEEMLGEFQENAEGLFRGVLEEIQNQVTDLMTETKNELLEEARGAFRELHRETEDFFALQIKKVHEERESIISMIRSDGREIFERVHRDIQALLEEASGKMKKQEEVFLTTLQEKVDRMAEESKKRIAETMSAPAPDEAEEAPPPSPAPRVLDVAKKSKKKK
jgi:tetratricopeptide (TPR) repeat protein